MATIPESFKDSLQAYDPLLTAVFHPKSCRWEIWRYAGEHNRGEPIDKNKDHFVMVVREVDGAYRPLDKRTIADLASIDVSRFGHGKKAIQEMVRLLKEREANAQAVAQKAQDDQRMAGTEEVAWALKKDIQRLKLA